MILILKHKFIFQPVNRVDVHLTDRSRRRAVHGGVLTNCTWNLSDWLETRLAQITLDNINIVFLFYFSM